MLSYEEMKRIEAEVSQYLLETSGDVKNEKKAMSFEVIMEGIIYIAIIVLVTIMLVAYFSLYI